MSSSNQSNKLAIPALKPGDPPALLAIKHQLEVMNGTIGGRLTPLTPLALTPLASNATLAQTITAVNQTITAINQTITAINQIIARLNA